MSLPNPLPPLFYVNRRDRGRLKLTGRDRQSFLQGMVSNDVGKLTPGQGCYAFMLQATGQVIGDMRVLCAENYLLLDVEPNQAVCTAETLEKYLIMEKCRIADVSSETEQILIGGIGARAFFANYLGVHETENWAEGQNAAIALQKPSLLARTSLVVPLACDVYLPDVGGASDLDEMLNEAGAIEITPDDLDVLRVQAGVPRFGVDMDATILAPETGQAARAISYRKGCYIGQEIVARIHARGHTNRAFVGFFLSGDENATLPVRGMPVATEENANAGRLTSVAPAAAPLFTPVALGYIRHEFATPGTNVTINGQFAQVGALPFAEMGAK